MGKKSSNKSSKAKAKTATQQNPDTDPAALEMHTEEGGEAPADKENTIQQVLTEEFDSDDGLPTIKRRHVPEQHSPEQEQTLVEWFSEHPLFFDQTEAQFKNRGKKDRLLSEKAKEFNMSGTELAVWFKSQRTIYGRLNKKKYGQAKGTLTARQKWVTDNFSFLKSHMVVRSDMKQLGNIPTHHSDDEDDKDEDLDDSVRQTQGDVQQHST